MPSSATTDVGHVVGGLEGVDYRQHRRALGLVALERQCSMIRANTKSRNALSPWATESNPNTSQAAHNAS